VATLSPDQDQQTALSQELALWKEVTVGELAGRQLALVAQTATEADHETLLRRLEATAGVIRLRLAYYDFSDVTDFDARLGQPRRRGFQGGSRCNDGNS
jgi:hypothetical protein